MKQILVNAVAAAAALALSGCATVYRVSETACPEDPAAQYAAPAMRNPVVLVDVKAGGEQADNLAASVRTEVENSLASRGFSVSANERPVGGLGIYLCKQMMDSITYRYEDGNNVLIMKKLVSPERA